MDTDARHGHGRLSRTQMLVTDTDACHGHANLEPFGADGQRRSRQSAGGSPTRGALHAGRTLGHPSASWVTLLAGIHLQHSAVHEVTRRGPSVLSRVSCGQTP